MQLFLEDFSLRLYWRLSILNINKSRVLHDIAIALNNLTRLSGFKNFWHMTGLVVIIFSMAAVAELFIRFLILRPYLHAAPSCPLVWTERLRLNLAGMVPRLA